MKKGIKRQDICLVCKKSYYKYRNALKYCSRSCSSERKKVINDMDYLEKIKIKIMQNSTICPFSNCWNWNKHKDNVGRGKIWFKNTTANCSKISYIVFKSEVPAGFFVCHKCDNYSCVNPDHLFLGSPQENVNDREIKKKGSKR